MPKQKHRDQMPRKSEQTDGTVPDQPQPAAQAASSAQVPSGLQSVLPEAIELREGIEPEDTARRPPRTLGTLR